MQALPIAFWMLRRVSATPMGWLWMLGSAISVPALIRLTPEGVIGHGGDSAELVCQLAFLSSMLGAMLGLAGLARNDWILDLSSPGRKLIAQATGLLTAGLVGAGLVTLGAWMPIGHGFHPGPSEWLLMAITAAHLAAIGTALLLVPRVPQLLPAGLPLLGWLLPAVLPRDSWSWLQDLLRASRDPVAPQDWTPAEFLGSIGPILVWVGFSWFLAQRRSRSLRPSPQ